LKQSKALMRALSNELLTTSVFMLLVGGGIFDMEAGRAAGWTSVLWIVLLAYMGFVDKTWKLMDAEGPSAQVIQMAVSTFLAAGFFLGW
jgi:uncharacterized membrane protein SpoIIM required for sporulation